MVTIDSIELKKRIEKLVCKRENNDDLDNYYDEYDN